MLNVCLAALLFAASDDRPPIAVIELPSRSPNFEETRGELLRLRGLLCTAWVEKRILDVWVVHAGVDTSSREKLHLAPSPAGEMTAELVVEQSHKKFDRMILVLPDGSEVGVSSRSDCAAIVSAPVVLRDSRVGSRASW